MCSVGFVTHHPPKEESRLGQGPILVVKIKTSDVGAKLCETQLTLGPARMFNPPLGAKPKPVTTAAEHIA